MTQENENALPAMLAVLRAADAVVACRNGGPTLSGRQDYGRECDILESAVLALRAIDGAGGAK